MVECILASVISFHSHCHLSEILFLLKPFFQRETPVPPRRWYLVKHQPTSCCLFWHKILFLLRVPKGDIGTVLQIQKIII